MHRDLKIESVDRGPHRYKTTPNRGGSPVSSRAACCCSLFSHAAAGLLAHLFVRLLLLWPLYKQNHGDSARSAPSSSSTASRPSEKAAHSTQARRRRSGISIRAQSNCSSLPSSLKNSAHTSSAVSAASSAPGTRWPVLKPMRQQLCTGS